MTEQETLIEYQDPAGANPSSAIALIELLERVATALEAIQTSSGRIADQLAPDPAEIVGTPYIAKLLDCTTVWIADMVRSGAIPKSCIVPGTGNGKVWKFYRKKIETWLETR